MRTKNVTLLREKFLKMSKPDHRNEFRQWITNRQRCVWLKRYPDTNRVTHLTVYISLLKHTHFSLRTRGPKSAGHSARKIIRQKSTRGNLKQGKRGRRKRKKKQVGKPDRRPIKPWDEEETLRRISKWNGWFTYSPNGWSWQEALNSSCLLISISCAVLPTPGPVEMPTSCRPGWTRFVVGLRVVLCHENKNKWLLPLLILSIVRDGNWFVYSRNRTPLVTSETSQIRVLVPDKFRDLRLPYMVIYGNRNIYM